MEINRKNYEIYFIDYLDGKLTDQGIRMLEDFLLLNQDLRSELEGMERIVLEPERIDYNQKDLLLRPDLNLPVHEANFEDFCIAAAEGDLNPQQLNGLSEYTYQLPGAEKTVLLFKKLHLSPDKNITYAGKEKLKKSFVLVPRAILYPMLTVAAALAFILIVYVRNLENSNNNSGIAMKQYKPSTTVDGSKNINTEKESIDVQNDGSVIQEASVVPLAFSKSKKKPSATKARESLEKKTEDKKIKELHPDQRLNPSFQIKLPSIAENQVNHEAINPNRITYNTVKPVGTAPEYLTLSEYARKQITEKVLDGKKYTDSRITAWQIADAGITGINKLTGGEMKLEKRTGEDGTINAYSFSSKLLSFSTTSVK